MGSGRQIWTTHIAFEEESVGHLPLLFGYVTLANLHNFSYRYATVIKFKQPLRFLDRSPHGTPAQVLVTSNSSHKSWRGFHKVLSLDVSDAITSWSWTLTDCSKSRCTRIIKFKQQVQVLEKSPSGSSL